ncbi:LOX5 lipoxygenase, partial [Polypterus senegalus]
MFPQIIVDVELCLLFMMPNDPSVEIPSVLEKMATYKLFVATGTNQFAGTNDNVYATVIGKQGESGKKKLDNFGKDHYRGCVGEYHVRSKVPLGDILFVELEKRSTIGDDWFCRYVEVKCPDGTCKIFPCYRWFVGNMTIRLRESSARKVQDDTIHDFHYHRQKELQERQQTYRFPMCFIQANPWSRYETQTALQKLVSGSSHSPFKLKNLFSFLAYVMEHWKEDWFFGYQFLNGCNPRMIKSCRVLPVNFPVTEDMVQATLGPNTTLDKELNAGTIYLVDYNILDGIPANKIRGKHQYITAPLCLLYEHPERGLIPLAIQIQQKPGQDNPIFLPSDSELDWLLAKMWVRHAEFQVYEALSHLLCTHLVCEVFCIATMRQLPAVHPVYKLLIPHMRDTLEINTNARLTLVSDIGIFKQIVSTGGEGLGVLLQKECQKIEFMSLLPKSDFEKRGVSQLKNYVYRDDCLKVWDTIESFVSGIVDLFYSSDDDVKEDKELQNWIDDVVTEGFKDLPNFGLPRNIEDKKALVTILAGVIFTSSALHAAINNGQVWLGQYPEDHFTEKAVKHHIDKFQEALKKIEKSIEERNANRKPLCPEQGREEPEAAPLRARVEWKKTKLTWRSRGMATYKVTVATGTTEYSGTIDSVYATLIGEHGESKTTALDNLGRDFRRGTVGEYDVCSSVPLGEILFVELEKRQFVGDNWFCCYVKVNYPDGTCKTFPCYRWFVGNMTIRLREGSGKACVSFLLKVYSSFISVYSKMMWQTWRPAIPKCIDVISENDIPEDYRFNYEKRIDFKKSLNNALKELLIKELLNNFEKPWHDLEDFQRCLRKPSPIAAYVMEHWKEDSFFGYQFLNGCNPRMIKSCYCLPKNFPVTKDMVQATLGSQTTLDKEMKAGNIYLVDYCILEGIPANVINGKWQYVTAPLCLLYDHPMKGLIPLAIQIQQKPDQNNPIFLPSDPELDWLLAKMWVRHAEFQVYEVLSHLLHTHLVSEVFCIATMRQLPAVHPVYKLLFPHMHDTLEINTNARLNLISENGIFKEVVSTGGDGLLPLLQRECKKMKFKSLLPTFDFEERDVNRLKNYFYRDDSLKIWNAIKSFVSGIVDLYYSSDKDVMVDKELQNWIHDVYDWCSWVPNTPCTMRSPPPPKKGLATMELIMNTLPDIHQSCTEVAITWVLSREQPIAVFLGHYPEYFTEETARAHIKKFQEALGEIEKSIEARNTNPKLKYEYLLPRRIENSIAI